MVAMWQTGAGQRPRENLLPYDEINGVRDANICEEEVHIVNREF